MISFALKVMSLVADRVFPTVEFDAKLLEIFLLADEVSVDELVAVDGVKYFFLEADVAFIRV